MTTTQKDKRFFYSLEDKEFIVDTSRKYWAQEVEEVIARADMACNNTFVFTHRWDMERCEDPFTFQDGMDWTYQYSGDFEWTVNLNRSRFMAELGQAYWLTDNEKYAKAYIRLLKDWVRQNPLTEQEIHESKDRHYNVKDTWRKLDSGIRITNWVKGYHCVRNSSLWGEDEEFIFLEAVKLHGLYLSIAYTPHDRQSNWGFLETNGLFQIASLFPHLEQSSTWLQFAIERLEEMCKLQIFEDGMHNEQSPMYHHEVLHCLFESVWLADLNQVDYPIQFKDSLNQLYTASLSIVKPGGHQPMLSDSDHTDIRDVLTRGAVLFGRGDLKHQGYPLLDYEGLWYFGQKGFEKYQALESIVPSFSSILLNQSGYSVMRSDWAEDGQYLIFDGGHMDIIRAHGHDDFLHVDLSFNGKDFLVDTGRYTYMETDDRKYFKESFQHNTTSVDDKSISSYVDSWTWENVAQPTDTFWNSQPEFDYVQAGHSGYMKLEDPVQVLRQILYIKPYYWIIVDRFQSNQEHDFKQHFHFSEECSIDLDSSSGSILAKSPDNIQLELKSLEPVSLTKEKCWISRDYNQKQTSTKVITQKRGSGHTKFITALIPHKQSKSTNLSISKVDVFDTRNKKLSEDEVTAIEVTREGMSEVILFSHQGPCSYQFSNKHMTGDVLFIQRKGDEEKDWIVKV
ncbi:alginate lyase family protein [Alkalihalobacillus sp. TS-13]|uniref:alginate lyase family protein n=1 Tax=Alkalihalobacillus sp. TS-13 TaxID=2842455 RepID=UPI0021AAE4BA|nr:alginate lyase family protein [Alkalihalobacillus sp. TS-13]